MESLNEVWESVCSYCKEEISEVAYKVWIDSLSPVDLTDGDAILHVRTSFQRTVILENYATLLVDAFESVLGFKVKLTVITDEDKAPTTRRVSFALNTSDYDYTFDTFIVGSSNRFAHAASVAVSEKPSVVYNPLFIYGNSGLGKTHLLHAIMSRMKKKFPLKTILYIRAEDFTIELIDALKRGTNDAFHEKYRTVDVLLVDDIQFIAGKESTQEEFFNTFNTLYQSSKQIVLTSDRPPKDIQTLDERIRSRFESGLIADIQPPDFETRVGIIQRKAQSLSIELSEEVVFFIAEQLKTNIRQLEGVVKKLQAFIMLEGEQATIQVAQSAIRDIRNDSRPEPVTIDKIIQEVARTYAVGVEDILSKKRDAPISYARQVAIYIVREITGLSVSAIGENFSGRDQRYSR